MKASFTEITENKVYTEYYIIYGSMTGFASATCPFHCSVASYDDDLAKLYYVGQVVQCQVLSVDHGKIRLSTKVLLQIKID